jgi:hypothetical protein
MFPGRHIPQYDDRPESWDRFLDKAAKGSAYAFDMLTQADLAYMASLTGDPTAPQSQDLGDYARLLQTHFTEFTKPATPDDLSREIQSAQWLSVKPRLPLSPQRPHEKYNALWADGRTVPLVDLVNDSIIHCHTSWSAKWLLNVINNEDSMNYNSVNVVAAMLMLAVTWKAT